MGWLGWTEAETLDHTPAAIRLAKAGRVDMINTVLKAVFGPQRPETGALAGSKMAPTAENFARVFRALKGETP